LGVTGLADMLVMMGIGYDSEEGRNCAAKVMQVIRDNAYIASINIAKEKGAFPLLNTHEYLHAPFIDRLPDSLKTQIAAHGIRNSHLLAIAPTGTISLLANNVSSGIEPIYALEAVREVRGSNLEKCSFAVRDYAFAHWLATGGQKDDLPDYFVTADALSPQAHLDMQSTIQCFVDNAISKTVNLPECATVDDVADTFSNAYKQGIKGCTIYRSGVRHGQVLRRRDESHCCDVEREAD
jgi:ribonucleoside-diphosphate reductase alpha chain